MGAAASICATRCCLRVSWRSSGMSWCGQERQVPLRCSRQKAADVGGRRASARMRTMRTLWALEGAGMALDMTGYDLARGAGLLPRPRGPSSPRGSTPGFPFREERSSFAEAAPSGSLRPLVTSVVAGHRVPPTLTTTPVRR